MTADLPSTPQARPKPFGALAHTDLDETIVAEILDVSHDEYLRTLASMTLEPVLFADRFGTTREQAQAGWRRAYERLDAAPSDSSGLAKGRIGLLCLSLELLTVSEEQARTGVIRTDFAAQDALLTDDHVRALITQVYAPAPATQAADAASPAEPTAAGLDPGWVWSTLDLSRFHLHRVGTTSFILSGDAHRLRDGPLALKCVLYPYSQDASIAHATRTYASAFPQKDAPGGVVGAIASSTRWILMPYVDGRTLGQIISSHQPHNGAGQRIGLDLLDAHGRGLIEALDRLTAAFGPHLDLTPSNIIVVDEGTSTQRAVFIDIGRNFLYGRRIGRLETVESVFVAPEVKAGSAHPSSDAYSLGLLLAALADPGAARTGAIPNSIYETMPAFAGFLEDLVDQSPVNRLLTGRQAQDATPYASILEQFDYQLGLEHKIRQSVPRQSLGREFWGLVNPSGGQVSQRNAIRKFVKDKPIAGAQDASWLHLWSATAMAAWYVSFAAVFIWTTRDLGLDLFPDSVTVLSRLSGKEDGIAFLDDLRVDGYSDDNWREHWPSRLICFALGVTEFKYYQGILAGLTARRREVDGARRAEIMLRVITVGTLLPILACVLIDPKLWPWAAFTGGVIITVANYSIYRYAQNCVIAAHNGPGGYPPLSTAPDLNDPNLEDYRSWWSSQLVYAIILCTTAMGLETGVFRDEGVYAVGIASATLGIQYLLKCHYTADRIRGTLNRAFLTGERVTAMRSRPSTEHDAAS